MRGSARVVLLAALALLAWSGAWASGTLSVTSPAFKDGDKMARATACEGGERSPALTVSGVPAEAKTLALLMTESAPAKAAPALWMAYNIPASATVAISENQPHARQMRGEGLQLADAGGKLGYAGPCPPQGVTRRYLIEVFALDTALDLSETATKQQFLLAVEGHILARGKIAGKYKK